MIDIEKRIEAIEAARVGVLDTFIENKIGPEEAMTLLTSLLVTIYEKMAENNDRDNFTNVMGQCYDAYVALTYTNGSETMQ